MKRNNRERDNYPNHKKKNKGIRERREPKK